MNASNQAVVDWPERIYYVCNSGSGIVVNATPLVQAGPGRIAGMRILCGVRDLSDPLILFVRNHWQQFDLIQVGTRKAENSDSLPSFCARDGPDLLNTCAPSFPPILASDLHGREIGIKLSSFASESKE